MIALIPIGFIGKQSGQPGTPRGWAAFPMLQGGVGVWNCPSVVGNLPMSPMSMVPGLLGPPFVAARPGKVRAVWRTRTPGTGQVELFYKQNISP